MCYIRLVNKETLQKYIDNGTSLRKIALAEGCSYTTVRYWVKRHGLRHPGRNIEKRSWTDSQLIDAVASSIYLSDVIKKLGLKVSPGNYTILHKHIKRLGISTKHFAPPGTRSDRIPPHEMTDDEVFCRGSTASRANAKRRLINKRLVEYKCSICSIKKWRGEYISLSLDHINGVNNDNRIQNLRLLCPNCHSQTDTFCSKNPKSKRRRCLICQRTLDTRVKAVCNSVVCMERAIEQGVDSKLLYLSK